MSQKRINIKALVCMGVMAALCILRLILCANMELYVVGGSIYDDNLQIGNAIAMEAGQWMGDYANPVLCKNPGFPMFLSFANALGISYPILLGLLIVVSSILAVVAFSPMIRSWVYRCVLCGVILFCPVNAEALHRIYRNALVPYFAIILVSAMIGLFFRRNQGFLQRFIWSGIAFLGLGAFYLLREDGIWILPFVFVLSVILLVGDLFRLKKRIKPLLFAGFVLTSVIPLLSVPVFSKAVSDINYRYYGINVLNDRTDGNEARVIGLLYRISEGSSSNRDVWISKATLQKAMEVSPTFAEVPQVFDYIALFGPVFGSDGTECYGDGIVWVIRSGVEAAGYYDDARDAERFYGKVAEELEQAFRENRILEKEGVNLSDTIVPLQPEDFRESLGLSIGAVNSLSHFPGTGSGGKKYTDVSYESVRLAEMATGYTIRGRDFSFYNNFINGVSTVFTVVSYPAGIIMLGAFILSAILLFQPRISGRDKKRAFDIWLMSLGTFLCAWCNIILSVLFLRFLSGHDTVYTKVYGFYDPAAAPLMYISGMLALYACGYLLANLFRSVGNASGKRSKSA